ncbi:MAG TPA: hypothetical protein PLN64_05865 [Candidatus Bipolaricaulis anaerobius]|nr:hypothetical protein [Candidatus Bipolaricaulis anaerobius]
MSDCHDQTREAEHWLASIGAEIHRTRNELRLLNREVAGLGALVEHYENIVRLRVGELFRAHARDAIEYLDRQSPAEPAAELGLSESPDLSPAGKSLDSVKPPALDVGLGPTGIEWEVT